MAARYRVRPAAAADLDALVEIERLSFSDPWTCEAIAEALSTAGAMALAAVGDPSGEVIGFLLGRSAAGEGEIHSLAVRPSERGQGVGRLLVDRAIAAFRSGGAAAVWLEVRESNVAARSLYGAAGFTVVGRRRNYYRHPVEDALVLRLPLE